MTLFDLLIGLPLCLALGVGFWWAGNSIRDRHTF